MPSGLSGGNGQLWVAGARPELLLGEYLIYEVPGAKAKVSTLLYGVFHVTIRYEDDHCRAGE